MWCLLEARQTETRRALWQNIMHRKNRERFPERVNVCPLLAKPCILSDWLTGSAGAMLESNWVRVCELEERSLNVSHCCRRQTDSEKRNKTSVSRYSDITLLLNIIGLGRNRGNKTTITVRRRERGGAELSVMVFCDEEDDGSHIMMDTEILTESLWAINEEGSGKSKKEEF